MGWTNIKSLLKSKYVAKIVGFEPNNERKEETRHEFNIEMDSLDAIWRDPAIRLVFITSPGNTHRELAIAAMWHGKSVMLEKPMGLNLKEMEEILAVQRETGAFFQLGFECRYSKLYQRIKDIIDSGEIGIIKHINFNYHCCPYEYDRTGWRNWKFKKEESGGIFQEKLCHYVDLTRWWIKEPVVSFFATMAPNTIPYYEIPDNVQCTYQFQNGAICHITFMMQVAESGNVNLMDTEIDIADQVNDGHRLTYVIAGTEGAIEAAILNRELRIFHHQGKPGFGGKEHMVRVERWTRKDDYHYFHNTISQNEDIVRRVVCSLPPGLDPEDAAESMRLCFGMEDAITDKVWKVVEIY